MAFSHNLLILWTIRNLEMLAIFTSNQGRHEFGENYEKAVVKKTERHSRLVHTKKWGKYCPVCGWSSVGVLPLGPL